MIAIVIFTIVCFLVGAAALATIREKLSWSEMLLAPALGLGGVGLTQFILSICHLSISRWTVSAMTLVAVMVLIWRRDRFRQLRVQLPSSISGGDVLKNCRLLPFLFLLGVVAFTSFPREFQLWDAVMIWGTKARVLYYFHAMSPEYFQRLDLSYSHLDYPLLLPVQYAVMHALHGAAETFYVKYVCVFTYLSLVMLVYYVVCSSFPKNKYISYILTIGVCSVPYLLSWSGSGYAELTVILFLLGSMFFCQESLKPQAQRSTELIASLFLCFLLLSKNEGVAMCGIIMLSFSMVAWSKVAYLRQLRILAMFIVLAIPYFFWRSQITDLHENYTRRVLNGEFLQHIERIPVILIFLGREIVNFYYWGGTWLLLLILPVWTIIQISKRRPGNIRQLVFSAVVLLGQFLLFLVIYLATPHEITGLLQVTLRRLLLLFLPALFLWWVALEASSQEVTQDT